MSINSRIKIVRKQLCNDSTKEFADKLKVSSQAISNYTREGYNVGREVIENILNAFPDLDANWLLLGNDGMLLSDSKQLKNIETVLLLPLSAQGGSLNDFLVSVKNNDCERIISPIKGADFAITVTGESMAPEYPNGSQILIKRIDEKAFIDWGRVYVLDTCNGIVIKRLFPTNDSKKLLCRSINKDFPDFEIKSNDIFGVFRVMMCMSLK
jgi:SOS-response transcriptional repressor LexA